MRNSNPDTLQYIHPKIAQNSAVFPDRAQQSKLKMLHDLDRDQTEMTALSFWRKPESGQNSCR
jgi:hypothetical protein